MTDLHELNSVFIMILVNIGQQAEYGHHSQHTNKYNQNFDVYHTIHTFLPCKFALYLWVWIYWFNNFSILFLVSIIETQYECVLIGWLILYIKNEAIKTSFLRFLFFSSLIYVQVCECVRDFNYYIYIYLSLMFSLNFSIVTHCVSAGERKVV